MRAPEVIDLEDAASLGRLSGEWLGLARKLPACSYFQTPDWVLTWWETLAREPPTKLALWRGRSGELAAIIALSREHQPLHRTIGLGFTAYVNSGTGPGSADHCGWLVSPGWEAEVQDWLSDAFGDKTLLLRSLQPRLEDSIVPRAAQRVESYVCPRLAIPPEGEPIGRSPNFRRQLRYSRRRLRRQGVVFEWVRPGEGWDSCLRSLFLLHERGHHHRKRRFRTFFSPEEIGFHRQLAERGDEARGPSAVVARVNGRTIGVLYGFAWGNVFYAYQAGWDPAWEEYSIGSVLLHEAILAARSHGAEVFDFLRGAEPYKYRFGATDVVNRTWLVPIGIAGWALERRQWARRQVRGLTA